MARSILGSIVRNEPLLTLGCIRKQEFIIGRIEPRIVRLSFENVVLLGAADWAFHNGSRRWRSGRAFFHGPTLVAANYNGLFSLPNAAFLRLVRTIRRSCVGGIGSIGN